MSHQPQADWFESFNARNLSPTQVAETFVAPKAFAALIRRNNSILIGPRGSGKTTLLKMLQQRALESWKDPEAESIRKGIAFTGIFVGIDLAWSEQLRNLGGGQLTDEAVKILGNSAFVTTVLMATVQAFIDRNSPVTVPEVVDDSSCLTRAQEANLCAALCRAFVFEQQVPSLEIVKVLLENRLLQIYSEANREAILGAVGREARLADSRYLHLDCLQSVRFAINTYNRFVSAQPQLFALLIDELELAPSWIQKSLVTACRSSPAELLLKISVSPQSDDLFTGIRFQPEADQDLELIPLWFAKKGEASPFCEKLWALMAKKKFGREVAAADILGMSDFHAAAEEWRLSGSSYTKDNKRVFSVLRRLRADDASFRKYLSDHSIDLNHLESVTSKRRPAVLRKIGPIALVREYYRNEDGSRQNTRSRHGHTLFSGADVLFAVSEGNPRWFISITQRILDSVAGGQQRISSEVQSREIWRAADRFRSRLGAIPGSHTGQITLLELINKIEESMYSCVVKNDFVAEPPGSFVIDKKIDLHIQKAIKIAVNAGAIVYIPKYESESVFSEVFGRKFRLCYLLAARAKLPLRLGKSYHLSAILSSGTVSMRDEQMELEGISGDGEYD